MSEAQSEVKTTLGRGRRGGKRGGGEAAAGSNANDDRPKTAGRGRGRGRGGADKDGDKAGNDGAARGRGEGRGGQRRAQTARQAADAAEGDAEETKQPRGGDRRNNNNNNEKRERGPRQQDKAQDKNSWIYKYHNMDRPQYEKIAFTESTVIPELPAKKDILKEPTKPEFEREMAAQDGLIQDKRSKKESLIKHRRSVREGGFTNSGDKTKKGELTDRINSAKGIRATKRQNQDAMRDIVSQIQTLEQEKRSLLKLMNPECLTVDAVNQEVKDLDRRLTTTSMSAQAEGRLIKDIDILKASIPKARRYQEIEPAIKQLKSEKNKHWTQISEIKAQEDVLNKEMEEIRKELEQTNQQKDATNEAANKIQEQIEAVDEELSALYAAKDEKREAYWKGRYDFKLQREEIMHIEWMQRQKDKILLNQEYKLERENERKNAIKSLPHPYLKELDCCEHLIGYLNNQKVRAGLVIDNEAVARAAQEALAKEAIQEKINQKLDAGKVMVTQSKAEREAAATVSVGGGRKNKGKKQKKVVEYDESVALDMTIIREFAMIGVAAPVSPDDLEDRLEKVNEKKDWFNQNGGQKLQEQIEEFEKFANEEDKEYEVEEPEADEEQPSSRGGRGRGRGSRGGYGGGRDGASRGRGRGRGGYGGFQVKNEFDGEEDDDNMYSAPTNKPKRNKQKQEDLKMDDDNYPTL